MRAFSHLLFAAIAFGIGFYIAGLNEPAGGARQGGKQLVTHGIVGAQQPDGNEWNAPEIKFNVAGNTYTLMVPPDVFTPREATHVVLPLLDNHPEIYQGKRVLEIGGGSGINAVYMALGGAEQVVATDISPAAIASINANAENLGVADKVDARLVSGDDISAYAVINDAEQFDLIISNPPYHLNLDTDVNTPTDDSGELGFSIVLGYQQHLAPEGLSLLFYNSLFYHELMVKYARFEGYDVSNHFPTGLSTREAQILFNHFLPRMTEIEGLPVDEFTFVRNEEGVQNRYLRNVNIDINTFSYEPLIQGTKDDAFYPGWIAIRNK
jgi:SAM-dependent methyltransferase